MGKLAVFNFMTLNGFYKGQAGDISWHRHGQQEESDFAGEGAQSGSILVFGRVTYEMMAGYWPSPAALHDFPVVADGMNKSDKIVFSRTLKKAEWKNTRLIRDNIFEEIKKLKEDSGKDLCFLGSGSTWAQFAERGLIDEFQLMVDPVLLGQGSAICHGITNKLDLRLASTRTFKSGVVLLRYQPA